MKQNGSSDVKASLWIHLDKKVLLWHREAPLFVKSVMAHFESISTDLYTLFGPFYILSILCF